MLPRVRKLEQRFGEALLAIGIHAGKYTAERRTPNIADACQRLGVAHPVLNDRQFRVWRAYAVRAWPPLAFLGSRVRSWPPPTGCTSPIPAIIRSSSWRSTRLPDRPLPRSKLDRFR